MIGCYLTTLPRAFMRGVADFDPDYAGSYFLPRETCLPPPSLLRRVWPDLDRWLAAHQSLSDATEVVDTNRAARNFLELLARLRVVFLQVEVILPRERLLEIVRRTNPSSRTLSFGGESFPTTLSSVTPSSPPLSSPPSPRTCSTSVAQRERRTRTWSPSRRRYLQWRSAFGRRLPPSRRVTRPQSRRWRISGRSW
jgi:hypothetical protein